VTGFIHRDMTFLNTARAEEFSRPVELDII